MSLILFDHCYNLFNLRAKSFLFLKPWNFPSVYHQNLFLPLPLPNQICVYCGWYFVLCIDKVSVFKSQLSPFWPGTDYTTTLYHTFRREHYPCLSQCMAQSRDNDAMCLSTSDRGGYVLSKEAGGHLPKYEEKEISFPSSRWKRNVNVSAELVEFVPTGRLREYLKQSLQKGRKQLLDHQ